MAGLESLSGIVTFVEAARAGSFTAAGERLGISKSAVGKSVSRLEERLGTKLFHRSTRKLALTSDGEAYLTSCGAALDGIAEAEAVIGGTSGGPSGRLRIDLAAAFGRHKLLPVLTRIARDHPALHLTLSFTDRVIDPVEEGVDLVIRFGETKDSSGLIARKLTEQRRLICAAPGYIASRGRPRHPDDLANHACIVGYRLGASLQWFLSQNGKDIRISPPPTHQIGDGDAIISMTLAGAGLSQMPVSLVRQHIEAGDLVPVLEEFEGPPVPIYAVWPGTRHLSPKLRFIVDALRDAAKAGTFD